MKHLVIRLVISLFTFAIGIASFALLHPGRHHANSQDEQAVLQVERQYIEAHLNADTETLDKILADDFTIGNDSDVVTKARRLAQLSNPNFAFEAINTGDVEVEVNGDHAVVTGEAHIQTRQSDMLFNLPAYRFVRNYEKRDGRWQVVSVRTSYR